MKFSDRVREEKNIPAASPSRDTAGLRFCLLGGFLGAGKTSFLRAFAAWLGEAGFKVGLVANDQAGGLVDALRMQSPNKNDNQTVAEVTGGCFCCRADDLVARLKEMAVEAKPDVIVAEPVGSCTDLVATVLRPLEQHYGMGFSFAPYVVLVDAKRLAGRYGISKKTGAASVFHSDVEYIFDKQLEEADVLVLNKIDLLTKKERHALQEKLGKNYPQKPVFEISVKQSEGLETVFTLMLRAVRTEGGSMVVDYERYAMGEAMLGWMNAELSVHAISETVDGNALLLNLAREIQRDLQLLQVPIAHLKLSLEECKVERKGGAWNLVTGGDAGVVQIASNGERAALSQVLPNSILLGKMLVNVRAEGSANAIRSVVQERISNLKGARAVWREEAAFQPGRPVPVHRIA
jgi:Ni2+-binding GTPase involved in maturation of urease and hydrogenase